MARNARELNCELIAEQCASALRLLERTLRRSEVRIAEMEVRLAALGRVIERARAATSRG